MKYDAIIIGAGIAGLTAAIYLGRAGKKVLVLEAGVCGGQIVSASKVENWPGDYGVSGAELMKKICQQAIDLGAVIKYEEVMSVSESVEYDNINDAKDDVRKLWLVETDESWYLTKIVIIATGTKPRELSEAQAKDAGDRPISYCATCDGALYKGKSVVVIGSGNTAKHEAMYLSSIASTVYHIHHDDPIPDDAEAVFVAIGRTPATSIFKDFVDMDEDGYIVAGEDCATSCPGVFAIGDCRTKAVRQLVTAAGDAAVVANEVVNYLNV